MSSKIEIKESIEWLYSLQTFGIKLGLENIINFLEVLDNPQQKLKTFHVAGSNGKGSTSAFLSSILQEFGYRTGLYTSPHFVRFNERIKIDNREISDESVSEFVKKNKSYIDEHKLTFFEVTTAMAFDYFNKNKLDYVVIETGLGGRLDATNVISPVASIITSISLEHTNVLGSEIKQITGEKAGIIKRRGKVFIGDLPAEAVEVIEGKCKAESAELFKITDYIYQQGNVFHLYTEEIELDDWKMPLKGDYQKRNAALAGLTVTKALDKRNYGKVSEGIKNVIKNTGLQGRYEFFRKNPDIIFDSAHNIEGLEQFLSEFRKDLSKYKVKKVLFGAMRDKPVLEMLGLLRTHFDEIHVTGIETERALSIEELVSEAAKIELDVIPEYDFMSFISNSEKNRVGDCVAVLGSMYLLGAIKKKLQERKDT